jgi:hypothetical protein
MIIVSETHGTMQYVGLINEPLYIDNSKGTSPSPQRIAAKISIEKPM